jgi:two-component system nitrogen regulation sensor histidine kinase NtrY
MNLSNTLKIRILLLLLTLCFAGTAITIKSTYTEKEILLIDGNKVEKNLHKKEAIVKEFLDDESLFERVRNIDEDPELKKYIIETFGQEKGIYIYTYSNNDLVFWGSEQIVPRSDAGISEGSSVIKWNNGWYESYKKSAGGFSVVCLIPIKANYPITNRYLNNDFSQDLINSPNLEVANYDDVSVYNLRNSDGAYLLSLKLSTSNFKTFYSTLELLMWLLAGLTFTIFINNICYYIAKKGWVKLSILAFALFLISFRYLDIKTQWLANNFYSGFFDPRVYASSAILPSLGALILHIASATWLVCYIYHSRSELKIVGKTSSKFIGLLVYFLSAVFLYFLCEISIDIFRSLIIDSSISFEVNNILNLNVYSWVGVLLLCMVVFTLYLIVEILFVVIKDLGLSKKNQIICFAVTVLICFLIKGLFDGITLSFCLFIIVVYIKGWYASPDKSFNMAAYVALLFLFAGIASLKQNMFLGKKQQNNQLFALQKLESSEDPNAVLLFLDIEKEIVNNESLIDFYRQPEPQSAALLNDEIRRAYFSGYLAKYDFSAYLIDIDSSHNRNTDRSKFSYFKDKVISGSRKVSANFYRLNNNIGYINYFALLPVEINDELVGTYVIELKNKSLGRYESSPELLFNGTLESSSEYDDYSYVYYQNGDIKGQHGSFVYPVEPDFSPSKVRQYIWHQDQEGYNHIIYRPNQTDLLILSAQNQSGWDQLASLSFLFLVFLFFSIILYCIRWVFVILNDYDFNLRNLRWSLMILQNRVLYSTRIQAFVVLAVVGTLVIAGIITFFSLNSEYNIQQEKAAIKQISQIARGLEIQIQNSGDIELMETEHQFNAASEINASDLNLYNDAGELIYSTQGKIYDLGLVSKYMNANAWLNVDDYAREEFFQRERIGALEYLVAYAPLKNDNNESVAYLSLPYFSNQKELDQQVGLLLNTIINVYALVLVALGLFAVFIANKITSPLTLVQRSLARTTIGKKNEPIFWKRNDEIGSLIKEYNNMIAALDNSANRIMRSERESAWREMAKQVAHEIKNPLTPLRLGVQLLERSWREKDPRFDEKFERFSKSFIEQIESLNHIASEFSNFAKMPDTKLDDVEIIDVIEKSISIYNNDLHLSIKLDVFVERGIIVHGDRDQLLRTFNNLIKNAIEARIHHKKSTVLITVSPRSVGYILIAIQDYGKGIDDIVRSKIFQPNFTTKSSGTGLGLAFVKQTVESMNGTISFKTERAKGTTFFILLPLKSRII